MMNRIKIKGLKGLGGGKIYFTSNNAYRILLYFVLHSPSIRPVARSSCRVSDMAASVCLSATFLSGTDSAGKDQDLCTLFACALTCCLCCLPLLVLCLVLLWLILKHVSEYNLSKMSFKKKRGGHIYITKIILIILHSDLEDNNQPETIFYAQYNSFLKKEIFSFILLSLLPIHWFPLA